MDTHFKLTEMTRNKQGRDTVETQVIQALMLYWQLIFVCQRTISGHFIQNNCETGTGNFTCILQTHCNDVTNRTTAARLVPIISEADQTVHSLNRTGD